MERGYQHSSSQQQSGDLGYPSAPPLCCRCPCHACTCTCDRATPLQNAAMTPMRDGGGGGGAYAGRWSSGLCDMASDLNGCVWTCCCPCVTFGHIVVALDQGRTTSCTQAGCIWFGFLLLLGLPCFCSAHWRRRLRSHFAIPAGECGDHCLHLWCGPCALCQEYRELKHRGLIPAVTSSAKTTPQQVPPMTRN